MRLRGATRCLPAPGDERRPESLPNVIGSPRRVREIRYLVSDLEIGYPSGWQFPGTGVLGARHESWLARFLTRNRPRALPGPVSGAKIRSGPVNCGDV